jgi:radical SAM protein with 4Fe4S-binding SPASM domain
MGKVTGFLEYKRLEEAAEAPESRKKHWKEFVVHLSDEQASIQGARCMDCGIPFCNSGCPVNNIIPTSTTSSSGRTGETRSTSFTAPTTSPSSPAVCARRRARPRAR